MVVVLSGVVAGFVLGRERTIGLLIPGHLTVVGVLMGASVLVLFGLSDTIKKLAPPSFPFDLDNALISVFTGFLLIGAILLVVE